MQTCCVQLNCSGVQTARRRIVSDEQFIELSGRIDGVARVLMHLVAELEMQGAIDGPDLSGRLRRYSTGRGLHQLRPAVASSAEVIWQIADTLDDARRNRSAARPG
jgi:hypothetical protein